MTTPPRKPEPMPPFIAWMSRHGIKVIAGLVLLEFLLHGFTLMSSKRQQASGALSEQEAPASQR